MWRLTLALTLILGELVSAQDETRQIFDTHFAKSRVAVAPSKAAVPRQYRRIPEPRPVPAGPTRVKGRTTPNRDSVDAALGVTIWKMKPSAAGDAVRLLVLEGMGKTEFTPHRVEAGDLLRVGDRVRLSIESPAGGFLYVVDQELYADGSYGPPYLIFPVLATRQGDNRVIAGQLIDIPDQRDPINAFTIRAKGPSDHGEKLTVLLSPKPISGLQVTSDAQQLSAETFRSWQQQVQSTSDHFELAAGRGQPWSRAEQEAGADPKRLLTLIDPAPQTVFIFPGAHGGPVLATLLLKFAQ